MGCIQSVGAPSVVRTDFAAMNRVLLGAFDLWCFTVAMKPWTPPAWLLFVGCRAGMLPGKRRE